MLTADLVRARRRGGKLLLQRLEGKAAERAEELAQAYLQIARSSVGETREVFEQSCRAVKTQGWDRRIAAGLLKLIADRCQFDAASAIDPRGLREQVFTEAAIMRRELPPDQTFERDRVLAAVAKAQELTVEAVEGLLYADLRAAQRLLAFDALSVEQLVADYRLAQTQAVLLRATKVVAQVRCRSAADFRYLFRQLRFQRLLFRAHKQEDGGYRLEIDGPLSLFSSVTKYGLKLALALPAIRRCERWSLRAELLWGKDRVRLDFEVDGVADGSAGETRRSAKALLSEEARGLLKKFAGEKSAWRAKPCADLLHLPGVGLCVPDLVFRREGRSEKVFVEVLGFWSRSAVWQRIELVRKGLPYRVLFAVSRRLRVGEAALDEELPGALYVFKGVLQKSIIEAKLDALIETPLKQRSKPADQE